MSRVALLVDDSLTIRMDLVEGFEAAGFETRPCATIAEARAALAFGPVDVVVLDVVLPDGDGVELLAELRASAATAEMPVLLLSSETEVRHRVRGLKTGADEYVGKPYDRDQLVARARELVRSRRKEAGDPQTSVLLVDDSDTYRESMRAALEAAGYRVTAAASGEEALRLAAAAPPNAILVDGVLPRMDGATVIRRVRLDAALRTIPCLLLTASDDRGAELRALDAGADAFVRKEEDVSVVLARLAAAMRQAPVAATADLPSSPLGPKRILAVDDSETYRQSVAGALRDEGYDVVLAPSGEEALELLAVQPVDCILLDLLMPGLSGQETCRRIKAFPALRNVPVIMLTALEDRQALLESLASGADDFISKSSEFEVLRARVRAQLRRKQFEDENRRIREELLRREYEATEARTARELSETRAALADELERRNRELEAFSYSVSHDLRAPLRSIDGFSRMLLEDCAERLDDTGRDHLARILRATQRMAVLIEDLLKLSRVSRADLHRVRVDLSETARSVTDELRRREPERRVHVEIRDGLEASGDAGLLRVVFENLIGNAWKFTSKRPEAHLRVGLVDHQGEPAFFVGDDGAGFDMAHAAKLFGAFQRLHTEAEFSGTGIGLATVQRIIDRHGGRVWAEGQPDRGATVYFTLPARRAGAA